MLSPSLVSIKSCLQPRRLFSSIVYFATWVFSSPLLHLYTAINRVPSRSQITCHEHIKYIKVNFHFVHEHCIAHKIASPYVPSQLLLMNFFIKSHTLQWYQFLLSNSSCIIHLEFEGSVSNLVYVCIYFFLYIFYYYYLVVTSPSGVQHVMYIYIRLATPNAIEHHILSLSPSPNKKTLHILFSAVS